jgi:hypothetical protein
LVCGIRGFERMGRKLGRDKIGIKGVMEVLRDVEGMKEER